MIDYAGKGLPERGTNNKHIQFYTEDPHNVDIFVSSTKFEGEVRARVGKEDYEFATAISHPRYRAGNMVVVAVAHTAEEQREQHNLWAARLLEGPLPDEISDLCIFDEDKEQAIRALANSILAISDGVPSDLLDATESAMGVRCGDTDYPSMVYTKTEPRDAKAIKDVAAALRKSIEELGEEQIEKLLGKDKAA